MSHTPLTHPHAPSPSSHPHTLTPFLTFTTRIPHTPSHISITPLHILTPPHTPTTHSHNIYPHTATQNAEVGEKEVWYSSRVLVEGGDAQTLYVGETVTLLNWGNLVITAIDK